MFCPNCGMNISDNISYCPNCGHKLNTVSNVTVKSNALIKSKSLKKKIIVIFSFVLILGVVLCVVNIYNNKSENTRKTEKNNPWYVSESVITYYDENGDISRKTVVKYSGYNRLDSSTSSDKTIKNTYDDNCRITHISTSDNEISFTYLEKGSKFVAISEPYDSYGASCQTVIKYNRDNQMVVYEEFDENFIISSTKYSYYPNGRIKTSEYESATGNTIVNYDEDGLESLTEIYNSEGELIYKQIPEYKDKRLVGEKIYNRDKLVSELILESNQKNAVKTIIYYEGEISGYNEYTYDDDNCLIEVRNYDEDKKLVSHTKNIWAKDTGER